MSSSRALRVIHTPTADWAAMRDFYRDTLLLPECGGWNEPGDRGAVLAAGPGEIELMELDAATLGVLPEAGGWRLALEVPDIQKEYDRLRALNVSLPRPIAPRPWGARDFVIQDPAGNWILIYQSDAP